MVIAPEAASIFIDGYSRLLQHVFLTQGGKPGGEILTALAKGRAAIAADASLIAKSATELEATGKPVPLSVLRAVQTSKLSRWVYLRDTTRYSVFLDLSGDHAYAVRGLTQPIRSILGASGITLVTALVEYDGQVICDGIVSDHVWLGPNYKREYSGLLAEAKKKGDFHVKAMP